MSLETREDLDPIETTEWIDSLESVLDREGEDRARFIVIRRDLYESGDKRRSRSDRNHGMD
ncbi:hypothetical protein HALO113_140002 [Halomonas sp. 113]|nr:hypothetical protein HALO113_140002 [Halomonas sp. 113]VXB16096.1 hypothetical protein HALO98_150002 [Halomonas titanicae]